MESRRVSSAGGASGEERRIGGGRDQKSEEAKKGRKLGGKKTRVGPNSQMTARSPRVKTTPIRQGKGRGGREDEG